MTQSKRHAAVGGQRARQPAGDGWGEGEGSEIGIGKYGARTRGAGEAGRVGEFAVWMGLIIVTEPSQGASGYRYHYRRALGPAASQTLLPLLPDAWPRALLC